MNGRAKVALALSGLWAGAGAAPTDIVLHLKGSGAVTRVSARYRCDAAGMALGLPAGVFTVSYVKSGQTSLAVVPVKGEDRVFAQVMSGSGARYAAGRLVWWDAREPTFELDPDSDQEKISYCESLR